MTAYFYPPQMNMQQLAFCVCEHDLGHSCAVAINSLPTSENRLVENAYRQLTLPSQIESWANIKCRCPCNHVCTCEKLPVGSDHNQQLVWLCTTTTRLPTLLECLDAVSEYQEHETGFQSLEPWLQLKVLEIIWKKYRFDFITVGQRARFGNCLDDVDLFDGEVELNQPFYELMTKFQNTFCKSAAIEGFTGPSRTFNHFVVDTEWVLPFGGDGQVHSLTRYADDYIDPLEFFETEYTKRVVFLMLCIKRRFSASVAARVSDPMRSDCAPLIKSGRVTNQFLVHGIHLDNSLSTTNRLDTRVSGDVDAHHVFDLSLAPGDEVDVCSLTHSVNFTQEYMMDTVQFPDGELLDVVVKSEYGWCMYGGKTKADVELEIVAKCS